MSNPAKPVLEINRAKSSAPTDTIELLSTLAFVNDAHRIAFAAYLGGGFAGANFLEENLGVASAVDLANVDVAPLPLGKHIIWSEPGITWIYRLSDIGALLNIPPRTILPTVAVGMRIWMLVHASSYQDVGFGVGSMMTFGSSIQLAGGKLTGLGGIDFESDTQRRRALWNTIQWEDGIDEYVGTGSSLETIETELLFVPTILEFKHTADGIRRFRLRPGNEVTNSPLIIRGLDWAPGTNEKVWETLA